MIFKLPELNYSYDALEPHIDKQTMEIHHTKHHQAYVDKLNQALEKYPEFQNMEIEEILKSLDKLPEDIKAAVRNNGGGHYNHDLFWKIMSPEGERMLFELWSQVCPRVRTRRTFQTSSHCLSSPPRPDSRPSSGEDRAIFPRWSPGRARWRQR